MSRHDAPEQHGLGTLEPGTRQRAQLPTRIADIAWSALTVLVALWAVWASVGAVRGTTAWAYCAVAWVLLAVALTMRVLAVRRRTTV
ncbi:hypothetical protein ABZ722_21080 [Streptomyces longwoodensis]|jgi:hypothetical protein|uniref:Uncharacterized protein n=1 Tax=Streptomyces lasalocidi TaxID=324833 RepID=A0A4U5WMT5_STRLS|nr:MULTISPECIES: hypothetical protein [Streptomyces]MCX4996647.1 hypothetical protein [Streptomyces longwoodensis]TKT03467.1 hypothetical protein E4U91_27480 [Streptomyces lasalocidi]WRY91332.1 hypothetical protein OG481_23720 [Streptomyces longwoodensis]WUC57169.1 hypothetical protein OHA09_08755 [Streptomyces longwoodensis]WUC70669.1 hypothetical protein OG416_07590 [Streptomyces longwoodensis]